MIKSVGAVQVIPNICVCLAAFNGLSWLPEQLNSIFNQTGVSVTVIVSVDRSTDGTETWIDQRALIDKRIIVLQHGRQFGGAAPNFFRIIREIDLAEFDYVSFADQDDVWLPNKLSRAHEVLVTTESDGYSSNVFALWPDGRKTVIEKSQPQMQWDFLFEAAGPGCTYVMKIELSRALQALVRTNWNDIQEVGLHDWFTYAFARANGYKWVIDDVPGMLYRQHEKNQVGVNAGWRAFVHRANKVLSGWGLAQSMLIARLVGLYEDPFVVSWARGSRFDLLCLALHAGQCRRRARDQLVFALSCVALSATGRVRR